MLRMLTVFIKRARIAETVRARMRFLVRVYPESLEFTIALAYCFFGFVLLVPYNSYAASHAYDAIATVLSEGELGLTMVLFGVATLFFLIQGSIKIRRVVMFISIFMWFAMTTVLLIGAWTTAAVDYVFAVGSFWAYIRLSLMDKTDGRTTTTK